MTLRNVLSITLALAAMTLPALADELQGVVHVVGSSYNMQTVLAPEGKGDGPDLCKTEIAKRIGRLSGMTVKATGKLSKNKDSDKPCLDVESFEVLKVNSGRDAVVGTLSQKDGQFFLTGEDSKQKPLANIPGGLRKMEGHKVIIDLKPIEGPSSKEASYKVVTYTAYP